jgi:hypothetical protein
MQQRSLHGDGCHLLKERALLCSRQDCAVTANAPILVVQRWDSLSIRCDCPQREKEQLPTKSRFFFNTFILGRRGPDRSSLPRARLKAVRPSPEKSYGGNVIVQHVSHLAIDAAAYIGQQHQFSWPTAVK